MRLLGHRGFVLPHLAVYLQAFIEVEPEKLLPWAEPVCLIIAEYCLN